MKLTTKFYASVLTVAVMALLSSILGLYAIWQIAVFLREMTADNIPSLREAEKLESSLLKQADCDESYLLDGGNPRWLKILADRKRIFEQWLAEAKTTTHDSAEIDILARLETTYRQYDAKRDEVFAIYDSGDAVRAKRVLLEEMDPMNDQVNAVCDEFIGYIEGYIDAATDHVKARTKRIIWITGGFVALTALSGCGLIWLFIRGVHIPLRKMIADARIVADAGRRDPTKPPNDEFSAAGYYLRTLMSDVASARSALKRSRQRAHNAEKLASVGKLAASVAHEIRNPLVAVKLWITTIQKKRPTDADLCRDLTVISDEVTRLDGIVRDFLEFSRPQALNLEPLQLGPLLDETLELVGPRFKEGRITLTRNYQAALPPALVDWRQLKQTLINLLNNAAEAMPDGGEISVLASTDTDYGQHPMVVVRVQDTGPGMPEEVQRRLFEPFFTTKESGTGLGLCIAAGILSRHGGRLVLESSNGQGTTFAAWIPAAQENRGGDLLAASKPNTI